MITTVISKPIPEKSTRVFRLKLRKEDGAPVQPATVRAWLRDRRSGALVAGFSDRDVLGTNGGSTVAADGTYTFRLTPDLSVCLDQEGRGESHVLLLRYTWGTDGQEHHEVVHYIRNLSGVV